MKSLFLLGGFAGFVVCAAAGLSAGRAPDLVLRDSALGCFAGAMLVRWFWGVLLRGFKQTLIERRHAAEQTAAAAQAAGAAARTPQPASIVPSTVPAAGQSRLPPLSHPKPATR